MHVRVQETRDELRDRGRQDLLLVGHRRRVVDREEQVDLVDAALGEDFGVHGRGPGVQRLDRAAEAAGSGRRRRRGRAKRQGRCRAPPPALACAVPSRFMQKLPVRCRPGSGSACERRGAEVRLGLPCGRAVDARDQSRTLSIRSLAGAGPSTHLMWQQKQALGRPRIRAKQRRDLGAIANNLIGRAAIGDVTAGAGSGWGGGFRLPTRAKVCDSAACCASVSDRHRAGGAPAAPRGSVAVLRAARGDPRRVTSPISSACSTKRRRRSSSATNLTAEDAAPIFERLDDDRQESMVEAMGFESIAPIVSGDVGRRADRPHR